jgi:hypothetical protein
VLALDLLDRLHLLALLELLLRSFQLLEALSQIGDLGGIIGGRGVGGLFGLAVGDLSPHLGDSVELGLVFGGLGIRGLPALTLGVECPLRNLPGLVGGSGLGLAGWRLLGLTRLGSEPALFVAGGLLTRLVLFVGGGWGVVRANLSGGKLISGEDAHRPSYSVVERLEWLARKGQDSFRDVTDFHG